MSQKKEDDFEANLAGDAEASGEVRTSWFKRMKKGILTSTKDKKDAPEGLWSKCPSCKYTCTVSELHENKFVCPKCEYHHRIGSDEYFELLFDDNQFTELFANIKSKDFLHFVDLKPYGKRLEDTYAKTGIHDSMTVAHGQVNKNELVIACMDFEFIGGSLGALIHSPSITCIILLLLLGNLLPRFVILEPNLRSCFSFGRPQAKSKCVATLPRFFSKRHKIVLAYRGPPNTASY